jgi:hemoglobin-like flavoprotein
MSATTTIQDHMQKSKAFAIRSIMGDQKLSRVLSDAVNAPAGSLKKAKAKAILESFSNAHKNYLASKVVEDGKGGVGLPASTGFSMNNAPFAKYAPTGFSLLPYQQNKTPQVNASIDSSTGLFSIPSTTTSTQTSAPSLTSAPSSVTNLGYSINPSTGLMEKSGFQLPKTPTSATVTKPTAPTAPTSVVSATPIVPTATPTTPIAPKNIETPEAKDFSTLNNIKSSFGDSYFESFVSSLSDSEKERLSPVIESIRLGEGESTFVTKILNDKTQLAKILGTPLEVVNNFPTGLLSKNLGELQDTVKQKYKLDEQLDNITNLTNQNVSVKSDLEHYIRIQDTYLSAIDKLLNDFEYNRSYQDESNPNTKLRNDNYASYLNLLKNRQNSRYVNYLDTAVTTQNNKLERAQNTYNAILGQAEKEYTKQAAITEESYKTVSNMLSDLFKNVAGRSDDLRQLETYELSKTKTLQNMVDDFKKKQDTETYSYSNVKQILESSRGDDFGSIINPNNIPKQGYVDTGIYKEYRDKASDKTSFDKNFSYLLNPNDTTAQAFIKESNSDLSQWEYDALIWQWLASDGKDASDEEKSQQIKSLGRNPESFGIYGY